MVEERDKITKTVFKPEETWSNARVAEKEGEEKRGEEEEEEEKVEEEEEEMEKSKKRKKRIKGGGKDTSKPILKVIILNQRTE